MCDNFSECHKPILIAEDNNCGRFICEICKKWLILRKDWRGVYYNIDYTKVFKRDILQPVRDNLFYKYYPQYLKK